MSQTPEGALKTSAKWAGVSVDEYRRRIVNAIYFCTRCKNWKPRVEYGNDKSRADGRARTCIKCRRKNNPSKDHLFKSGGTSLFRGRKHTVSAKARMSAAKKGLKLRLGKKHSEETCARISAVLRQRAPRGINHPAYKAGATKRNLYLRRQPEYFEWRKAVFARDGYKCQDCGDSRGGNLRAHHEKPVATYPELAHDINNGVTLCHPCHELRHFKPDNIRNQRKLKRGERLWK